LQVNVVTQLTSACLCSGRQTNALPLLLLLLVALPCACLSCLLRAASLALLDAWLYTLLVAYGHPYFNCCFMH
jgi:hypothetical protein